MRNQYRVDTTPEENEELRDWVNAVREKWGTPQAFIARQTGISQGYLNQWINNHASLSKEHLKRIEQFLEE